MAFQGDPWPKRAVQAVLRPLGYKLVQLKAYEARTGQVRSANTGQAKVFCIGFNKTATTTVEAVLRAAGLRMPKQLDQEQLLAAVPDTGDYALLKAFCDDYDAFQDLPFSQGDLYLACDVLYPDARFVLTTRDPDAWADSYIQFYTKELGLDASQPLTEDSVAGKSLYLQPGYIHAVWRRLLVEEQAGQPVIRWDLALDRDFLIDRYQSRNAAIRAHFRDRPQSLLELDLATEPDTGRLLQFLGITDMAPGPYPRTNAR